MSVGFETLQDWVLDWGDEKGITSKATLLTQIGKTQEELTETRDAIVSLVEQRSYGPVVAGVKGDPDRVEELKVEIKDGIGDQMVTLILLANLAGLTAEECLEHAYNEIKDRTGKMVDGVFVKDEKEETE